MSSDTGEETLRSVVLGSPAVTCRVAVVVGTHLGQYVSPRHPHGDSEMSSRPLHGDSKMF